MIIKRYIIKSLEMIHVPHVAVHQHIGQYVGYFINVMLSVAGIAFIKCNLLLLINFINVSIDQFYKCNVCSKRYHYIYKITLYIFYMQLHLDFIKIGVRMYTHIYVRACVRACVYSVTVIEDV